MHTLITIFIVILGAATIFLSLFVAYKFRSKERQTQGDSKKLTSALKWQLAGEAVIGGGTLLFSVAAWLGVINDWSIYTHSLIRLLMFVATSLTTFHLMRTVSKIENV